MLPYFLAWFPMIVLALVNGALREAWLIPRLGEHAGRQVSTLLLIALLALYIAIVVMIRPIASGREASAIGAMWLVLTLAFEFLLGRFVSGLSWQQMLAEYDLAAGRLWVLVPVWVAIAPYLFFVFAEYRDDLREARERIGRGSQVVETPCGQIEYATVGKGAPLLFVHGAGGGFDQGLEIAERIAAKGFRIVLMSRFGYLRTPLPADASAAAQADAHACLLDALNISRAAIAGVSAGGPSSVQFALRHPQRTTALVLLVPAAYVPRPQGAAPLKTPPGTQFLFDTALRSDFVFWVAARVARKTVTRAILATPPAVVEAASAEEKARVARLMASILPVSSRRLGLLNDAAVTSTLPRYELERISAPTLVISVADDLFGTFDAARYTAERIPGARFVGYPTGGHLWVGHHAQVMSEIGSFLNAKK